MKTVSPICNLLNILFNMQCSSQEFQFWGPGAPTFQKVGDIWKNLGTVQSMIKIL